MKDMPNFHLLRQALVKSLLLTCLLLTGIVGFLISQANAMDLTEFGTLTMNYPSLSSAQSASTQTNPALGWGAGLSLDFKIYARIDLEIGVIYSGKSFSSTASQKPRLGYSMTGAHFPLLLRYWFSERFSAGGGMYYSHGVGNITVNYNSTSDILGYKDIPWNTDDVGIALSFRYRIPLNSLISFVLDTRALLGTRDMGTPNLNSFHTRELQEWVGIAFIL